LWQVGVLLVQENSKPFTFFLASLASVEQMEFKQHDDDVNGGVNHFGSPFNFLEEFVSVYPLHRRVSDLLEFRDLNNPNATRQRNAVIDTFRGKATDAMLRGGSHTSRNLREEHQCDGDNPAAWFCDLGISISNFISNASRRNSLVIDSLPQVLDPNFTQDWASTFPLQLEDAKLFRTTWI